jgi:hypothetical protein
MRLSSARYLPNVRLLLGVVCIALTVWVPAARAEPTPITRTQNTGEPTGKFSLTPSRFEAEVRPGVPLIIPIQLYNGLNDDVEVQIEPVEIGASDVPSSLIQVVSNSKFSATSWIDRSISALNLARNETAAYDLRVSPPPDTPPGTSFAGLRFTVIPQGTEQAGSKLGFRFSGLMQLFLNGPGKPERDLQVASSSVSDTFVLGNIRFVTYEVTFRNRGNVNERISGNIEITSMFRNRVKTIPIRKVIVLRGSERTIRAVWPEMPLFGRFSARVDAKSDADRITHKLPTVTVLPPWWWLLIIAIALALPVVYTVHRRRKWRRLMEENWDDDWLEDDEWDTEPT